MTIAVPATERILAVLRRPDDLYAVSSARAAPFTEPVDGPLAPADPFVHRVMPLREVSAALVPWRDKDVRTWETLGSVGALDAATGLLIVRVVLATVADPTIEIAAETGAEPPFDLRPALCGDEDALLAEMRPLLEALAADASLELPAWHWTRRAELRALPPAFRVEFLWTLSLAAWDHVVGAAAVYDALDLHDDAPLRRCIAHLFSLTPAARALTWCALVQRVPPHRRGHAVELIIESGAARRDATRGDDEAVVRGAVNDEQFRASVFAALRA